jgi:hypothetical protein
LAIAGQLPEFGVEGPFVTTYGFQFRMARAVIDSARTGRLSKRVTNPDAAGRRLLYPPAHRLVVLDSRSSLEDAVRVAITYGANLLLAELVGAARHHSAAIRVTRSNVGGTWVGVMEAEGIDFSAVDL